MSNSHLINYLTQNFLLGFDNQTLIDHFLNEFGVNVKIENDLYLFKYDMIQVKWNDITKECRGHILTVSEDGWEFVSRPWDKFYNLGEGHCPITNCDDFSPFKLVQKADGTAIQMYNHNGVWRISTLGTITTMNVGESGMTFEDLFYKVFGDKSKMIVLDPAYTYLFELTTRYNRIVTQYENDQIFLLGCRHKESGKYYPHNCLDSLAPIIGALQPVSFSCEEHNLIIKDRVIDFVEEQSTNSRFGKNSEGFIVYDENGVPLAKMKNQKYVALHHLCGGDPLASRNNILELIFAGRVDDVYGDLLPEFQEYVNKVQAWVSDFWKSINECVKIVHEQKPQTRKDYALLVKGHKGSCLLFKQFDVICNGQCLNIEHFNDYLKNSWKSYEAELKNLYNN
jgi:T4 RnlA family RNA ligase